MAFGPLGKAHGLWAVGQWRDQSNNFIRKVEPFSSSSSSGLCKAAEIKLLDMSSGHIVKRFHAGAPLRHLRHVWPHLDLVLLVHLVNGVQLRPQPLRLLDPATGAVSVLPAGYNNDTHSHSSFVFGKAAASEDGEYKVLSLSTPVYHNATQKFCKILTIDGNGSKYGAWRNAPAPPVAIKTLYRETVVASGVVYHLVDSSSNNGWTIAAFDLGAEQWLPDLLHGPGAEAEPVLAPASVNGSRKHRGLAKVNRCLAAVYSTSTAMDVWLLMGSGENTEWCKRCRVVLTSSMECNNWRPLAYPVPLWVLDDGRVAIWVRSDANIKGTLWMYDPRTERSTRLSTCLMFGTSVYTGNLLRHPVQHAREMEEL